MPCETASLDVTFALPLLMHNDSSLNTRFLPVGGVHPATVCLQLAQLCPMNHGTWVFCALPNLGLSRLAELGSFAPCKQAECTGAMATAEHAIYILMQLAPTMSSATLP